MPDPQTVLSDHPFAEGLSAEHLEILAGCIVGEVSWDTGTAVLVTGQRADTCYLITSGSVRVTAESPGVGARHIQTHHGGGVLGLSWLFPPFRWMLDGTTLEPTTAIALDAERLRAAIQANPDFGLVVVGRVATHLYELLKATRLQLLDLYGHRG